MVGNGTLILGFVWQTLPLYTGVLHEKQAFSSEKYLNLQRDHIIERINQFDGKLYLEFGGKMLEDFHAARVLPWIRTRQ